MKSNIFQESSYFMDMNSIEEQINDLRDCGKTTVVVREGSFESKSVQEQCNDVIDFGGFKFKPLLKEVSLDEAKKIITSLLHKDMAYNAECIPIDQAKKISDNFVNLFPINTKYYTNASFKDQPNKLLKISGWNSISSSTFDAGVIALSDRKQGIFWFEDED